MTERIQNNSISFRKKIVPYEDYLQIKNAYINIKEKNNKLKEEKQKIESLLNQYQSYISDYQTSNNTIKIIFKKLEKKYKDSYALPLKNNFANISISKIINFKIQNKKKNKNINEDEYKKNINKYIEIINQLKKEIKTKEELYENKNKENMNIINNKFTNLFMSKNIQFNLNNNNYHKKLIAKVNFDKLIISSQVCEYNILKRNKNHIDVYINKNLIISSKCSEFNLLKKGKPKRDIKNIIVQSKISEIYITKQKSIQPKQLKDNKVNLSISSNCLFTIEKYKKENKLSLSSKVCELSIIKKNQSKTKLIISPKVSEYNIYFDDTKKSNNISLMVNSKVNDICIKNKPKKILLEIKSKISDIIILKSKIKNSIFKVENQQLNFINQRKRKEYKEKNLETQKAIIDNYINSINIGFDNIKTYEDYNEINKEKDEDSDNENDKLECEPVPSFILCLQKNDKIK